MATSALATLSIDLEVRLARLEEGFSKANRLSEKLAADQERRFKSMGDSANDLAKKIGAIFTVREIVLMSRALIDGVDALNDLKDATGASIENISALEDVAARTGTSFESMSSTLVKFNKVLGDSKPGSGAANTLQALGLSAEKLKQLDPAEALRQTAVALAQFADDGNKARVVQELFGKSVAEAAPFLKDLAEQGQLNATVTTAQAQAAEDFNKQLFNLQKNLSDTGRAIAGDLLPALNTFFDRLKAIKEAGGVSAFFGSIGNEVKANLLGEQIADTVREIELLQKRLDFGGGSEYDKRGLERRIGALRQQFLDLQGQAAATNAALVGFADKVVPLPGDYSNEGRSRPRRSVGDIPDADKKTKAAKEKAKKEQNFVDTSVIDELIERQRELNRVIENTPTAKLEKQRQLQIDLAAAYEDGRFGIVGSQEALDAYIETVNTALPEAVKTTLPEMEKLADESSEFFREAARNIQDAMGDTLVDALSGDFDNIGKRWKALLLRMAAEAAAAKLNTKLFGSDYGNTGQLGGLLGSIFNPGTTYTTIGSTAGDSAGYIMPGAVKQSAGGGRQSAATVNYITVSGGGMNRGEVFDAVTKAVAASESRTSQRMRTAGVI